MKNKLDNSRELDVWLWSNKPEVRESTKFISGKIMKNIPSGYTEKNIKKHLRVILTDLFVAHKNNPKMYISFSRDISSYKASKKYSKIYLNYKYIIFVVDYLKDNGYIEMHKGVNFAHFSRMSRMKGTNKLFRLFRKYRNTSGVILSRKPPVFLRNSDKNCIDFDLDTLEVKSIIKNINRINKNLSNHNICLSNEVYSNKSIDKRNFILINDIKNKKYSRVFNNSSFQQGGRFYGHWSQMIESDLRRFIEIDGESTVELDYSCLHLSMLYGLENKPLPQGDLYKLSGIADEYRKYVKKSVNIAINAESERSAIQAIRLEYKSFIDEVGLIPESPNKIIEIIKWNHPVIGKYLCTGYGVHLQYIDSTLAENIMLKLSSENICCLCIHDSFIVPTRHMFTLERTMNEVFYDRFKFLPRVNRKI